MRPRIALGKLKAFARELTELAPLLHGPGSHVEGGALRRLTN